jgi:polysaccharide export outer membrane protein
MRAITLLCAVLAIGSAASPAAAVESTIRVGDTISISAFGLPELDRKSVVEKSGEISYPLLGSIKAAGTSPSDLRRRITEGLVQGGLARDPKIGVEIALREPFYVTGDVIKPGAQPYALNVTVRSAVALAGGLDPGGARGARATVNPAEIQGQYEVLALELVKQRSRMRTLEASIAGKKNVEFDDFSELSVKKDVVDKLKKLVTDELKMRADDAEAEKAYLQHVIADTQAQIAALVSRQGIEEEAVRDETDQVSKIKTLTDHGTVVLERLLNEKKSLALAQGKLFDTVATLASTRRLLEELQRKLQVIDETRRLTFVKELQDAYIGAAAAESRLAAARLQLNVKGGANQPHFVIYRENDGARLKVNADEDAEIQPGDIVEVRFGPATALAAD